MVVMAFSGLQPPTSVYMSNGLPLQSRRQSRLCLLEALTGGRRSLEAVRCSNPAVNYQPPAVWKDDYLQSLSSNYLEESNRKQASKLREEVRLMLDNVDGTILYQLELVDTVQRLGVSCYFEDEIKRMLESIYNYISHEKLINIKEDLYATALAFRLFRQHGYDISQDVFNNFKDETGNFKECLHEDIKGLLYLYEASYLSVEEESILDEARDFTTKLLKENLKKSKSDQKISALVRHSLEIPLHWRVPLLEARWFIDEYERTTLGVNPMLLELAKFEFNMVQAIHQEDLKHASGDQTRP